MAIGLVIHLKRANKPGQAPGAFGAAAERLRRQGDSEAAAAMCRAGLADYPDHVSARVTLGWALIDLGRFDDAKAELEAVLQRAPDNLAAIRGLAELHERADSEADADSARWTPKASSRRIEIEDVLEAGESERLESMPGTVEPDPAVYATDLDTVDIDPPLLPMTAFQDVDRAPIPESPAVALLGRLLDKVQARRGGVLAQY